MRKIHLSRQVILIIVISYFMMSCSALPRANESVNPFAIGNFPLTEVWRVRMDGRLVSTPVVRGEMVAVWTTKGLQLLEGRTGEKKWQYDLTISGRPMPPVVLENYIVASHGELVDILSAETGEMLLQLRTPVSGTLEAKSIATDHDRIYIVWGNLRLAAYSLATGEVIWQINITGTRASPDIVMCGEHKLCLVIRNRVEIYDASSGDMLGKIELGKKEDTLLYPVFDDKVTLFVVQNSIRGMALINLNLQTNSQNWKVSIPDVTYPPALYHNTVYVVGGMSGKIQALDATTGHELWQSTVDDSTLQTPVEFHRAVYVRSMGSGRIYAIDITNGQNLGSLQTSVSGILGAVGQDHPFALRPMAVDNAVLVIPSGSGLYGYAARDHP